MIICRLNWPFQHSFRLLDRASKAGLVPAGTALTVKVWRADMSATLATWTSGAGRVTAGADGLIGFDVPANLMAELVAGALPFELRRDDTGAVVAQGTLRVGPEVPA